DEMAWYSNNSGSKSHLVGTKAANAWGLNDMHGNVWEWCADWYGEYPKGAVTDPTGPSTGSNRVNRGGSWGSGGSICRSAYRFRGAPVYRSYGIGFRVAAVPGEQGPAGAAASGPASGAGARDERAALVPAAAVVDVAGAKAGERREADLGGGVKLELCGIPAGTFTMGGGGPDETPHPVTLTKPFWLGRMEVSQAQWEAVTGKNPSNFKGKNLPVETVSWDDASGFCQKLNAKGLLPAGWRWKLPTEAQWEYACRAGTTGDDAGNLDEMAWYSNNSGSKSHLVGTKAANAWGLNDMHGNVWEWCADWYGEYPKGAVTDPTGPSTGSDRVIRGGSWNSDGTNCRSAYRLWDTPDARNLSIGFRVAAVPAGP
ncbi:MAG: SUMF1/EgtB/PvdO family nonheme iron enzyme, partial [Verrucomicrobiota bacterium]